MVKSHHVYDRRILELKGAHVPMRDIIYMYMYNGNVHEHVIMKGFQSGYEYFLCSLKGRYWGHTDFVWHVHVASDVCL